MGDVSLQLRSLTDTVASGVSGLAGSVVLDTLIMLRKAVGALLPLLRLPNLFLLPGPALSGLLGVSDLRLVGEWRDARLFSSNRTSPCVCARVKDPLTESLPTSSELWNLPILPGAPLLPLLLENMAILARTPDTLSSRPANLRPAKVSLSSWRSRLAVEEAELFLLRYSCSWWAWNPSEGST